MTRFASSDGSTCVTGVPRLAGRRTPRADKDPVSTIDETTGPDWRHLDTDVEAEAERFPLKREHEAAVQAAIEKARRQLGGDSVDGHSVSFDPDRWSAVLGALPPHCVVSGKISRGDIFVVAGRGRDEDNLWRLFVCSYVWGQGNNGYGPARLSKIERATGRAGLAALINEAFMAGDQKGPLSAYDKLRGEHRVRGAAKHWGAAFFTKALYFGLRSDSTRSPLILDRVMARQVTQLSDMPHLLYRGFGYNWSANRYGAYLAWMRQTAEHFGVSPELLEYSLFKM